VRSNEHYRMIGCESKPYTSVSRPYQPCFAENPDCKLTAERQYGDPLSCRLILAALVAFDSATKPGLYPKHSSDRENYRQNAHARLFSLHSRTPSPNSLFCGSIFFFCLFPQPVVISGNHSIIMIHRSGLMKS
jgi:hypothetical protein